MAQAKSVPSLIQARITGVISNPSTNCVLPVGDISSTANTDRMPVWALGYATAVLLLGWFPWNVLLIVLLFLCRSSTCGSSV